MKKLKKSKEKYFSKVTLLKEDKLTKLSNSLPVTRQIKIKKCQSTAGDRQDLIQTWPVPSRGKARPKIKTNGTKNSKIQNEKDFKNVTLAKDEKHTRSSIVQPVTIITTNYFRLVTPVQKNDTICYNLENPPEYTHCLSRKKRNNKMKQQNGNDNELTD